MKIEHDHKGEGFGMVLKEVFSGVAMETSCGNRIGICMRDDTFEINIMPRDSGHTSNWWRINMQTGRITSDKDEDECLRVVKSILEEHMPKMGIGDAVVGADGDNGCTVTMEEMQRRFAAQRGDDWPVALDSLPDGGTITTAEMQRRFAVQKLDEVLFEHATDMEAACEACGADSTYPNRDNPSERCCDHAYMTAIDNGSARLRKITDIIRGNSVQATGGGQGESKLRQMLHDTRLDNPDREWDAWRAEFFNELGEDAAGANSATADMAQKCYAKCITPHGAAALWRESQETDNVATGGGDPDCGDPDMTDKGET